MAIKPECESSISADAVEAEALEADAEGMGSEKSSGGKTVSVLKLTQVGEANSLRRSRERS